MVSSTGEVIGLHDLPEGCQIHSESTHSGSTHSGKRSTTASYANLRFCICASFPPNGFVSADALWFLPGTGKSAHSKLEKTPVARPIEMAWMS